MNYRNKYLKYKEKYMNLKNILGGGDLRDNVIDSSSDEDLVNIPIDFFEKLRNIYPSCKHDTLRLNEKYDGHEITYGELEYEGMKQILDHVHNINDNQEKINNFIDLGSGRGKLPLYVAGLPTVTKSVGIELVTERHNDALEIKNKLDDYQEITNKVTFINDDFINVNLSYNTGDKLLVWISNLCLPQKVNDDIFNKLIKELPVESFIACSKELDHNFDKLITIGKLKVPMSWNKTSTITIYQIQ